MKRYSDVLATLIKDYKTIFNKALIHDICNKFKEIERNEQTLVQLKSPIIIVGDIHGNITDLLNMFNKFGYPPKNKYLFLGDYVDRGSYGTEVMIILMVIKILMCKIICD